jgi:hypothetical protein
MKIIRITQKNRNYKGHETRLRIAPTDYSQGGGFGDDSAEDPRRQALNLMDKIDSNGR